MAAYPHMKPTRVMEDKGETARSREKDGSQATKEKAQITHPDEEVNLLIVEATALKVLAPVRDIGRVHHKVKGRALPEPIGELQKALVLGFPIGLSPGKCKDGVEEHCALGLAEATADALVAGCADALYWCGCGCENGHAIMS